MLVHGFFHVGTAGKSPIYGNPKNLNDQSAIKDVVFYKTDLQAYLQKMKEEVALRSADKTREIIDPISSGIVAFYEPPAEKYQNFFQNASAKEVIESDYESSDYEDEDNEDFDYMTVRLQEPSSQMSDCESSDKDSVMETDSSQIDKPKYSPSKELIDYLEEKKKELHASLELRRTISQSNGTIEAKNIEESKTHISTENVHGVLGDEKCVEKDCETNTSLNANIDETTKELSQDAHPEKVSHQEIESGPTKEEEVNESSHGLSNAIEVQSTEAEKQTTADIAKDSEVKQASISRNNSDESSSISWSSKSSSISFSDSSEPSPKLDIAKSSLKIASKSNEIVHPSEKSPNVNEGSVKFGKHLSQDSITTTSNNRGSKMSPLYTLLNADSNISFSRTILNEESKVSNERNSRNLKFFISTPETYEKSIMKRKEIEDTTSEHKNRLKDPSMDGKRARFMWPNRIPLVSSNSPSEPVPLPPFHSSGRQSEPVKTQDIIHVDNNLNTKHKTDRKSLGQMQIGFMDLLPPPSLFSNKKNETEKKTKVKRMQVIDLDLDSE